MIREKQNEFEKLPTEKLSEKVSSLRNLFLYRKIYLAGNRAG